MKCTYAGEVWDSVAFQERVARAVAESEVLGRPARTLDPGHYRVYLAPAALSEVIGLLCWGGFGITAQKTRRTPLLQMINGSATLDSSVNILEDTGANLTANFDDAGFIKPGRITLME